MTTDLFREQIIETWRAHNGMMIHVIKNIPRGAMKATLSTHGGRGIAGQLAHIHTVRVWHLEAHARAFSRNLTKFGEGEVPTKAKLVKAFQQSGKAVEDYLEMRIGKAGHIPSFKRNAVPTLMYFVSHEAHHRGSIMLTIKTSGIKIPETLKWGIWDMFKFRNLTT